MEGRILIDTSKARLKDVLLGLFAEKLLLYLAVELVLDSKCASNSIQSPIVVLLVSHFKN